MPERKRHTPNIPFPEPLPNSVREADFREQTSFSPEVKNIFLAPIRAELHNGHLATFLRRLNKQPGQDKIGIVFLVSERQNDQNTEIATENHLTVTYLNAIAQNDGESINELAISDEYKDLARDLIEKGKIEVRNDHLRSETNKPHFGNLRLHLFKLGNALKDSSVTAQDMIFHIADLDTAYPATHMQTLDKFFADPSHMVNFTEQDFMPGFHENEPDREANITRELLLSLDIFRLYQNGHDVERIIRGGIASGAPTISFRQSFIFFGSEINPLFANILKDNPLDDDFSMGDFVRNIHARHYTELAGNVAEVHRVHRARTPHDDNTHNDAEVAYRLVSQNNFVGRGYEHDYSLPDNADSYIADLENQVATVNNSLSEPTGHTPTFQASDEYSTLIKQELQHENNKVRLRRIRFFEYLTFLQTGQPLDKDKEDIFAPYHEFFQDETASITQQFSQGRKPEEIMTTYIENYHDFFTATPIHTQIARLKALKKYSLAHNINLMQNFVEKPRGS